MAFMAGFPGNDGMCLAALPLDVGRRRIRATRRSSDLGDRFALVNEAGLDRASQVGA